MQMFSPAGVNLNNMVIPVTGGIGSGALPPETSDWGISG
jgi:hypothetical protein